MNTGTQGVLWALVAVAGWGFGDYLIQKVSREIGIWRTLFFVSIVGVVGLFPLVWNDLHLLLSVNSFLWLLAAGVAMTIGSIFIFESFKDGKLAIMEPVISAELPIAVLLAVTLWNESLSLTGWLLILTIFIGILLAVTEYSGHLHYHKRVLEKGVVFAAMGALTSGFIDLLMGASSQEVDPILTVWGVWLIGAIITFVYLYNRKEIIFLKKDFAKYPFQLIILGILDAAAWVGFVMAAVRIPISITAALTEGYIIIAIVLGLVVNHEKLKKHQVFGIVLAAIGVITLAFMVG